MDELQELQSNYHQKQLEFGQIKVQKILLEQQVDLSIQENKNYRLNMRDYRKKKEIWYKNILTNTVLSSNLDPNTGIFTPTS